jgi:hypothetical protein
MLLGLLAVAGLAGAVFGAGAASASHQATPTFAKACGTQPVTMEGYFETGFPDIIDLTQLFTKQYPNVKWHIRQDQFAVITQNAPLTLSGPNPPDLMRLPQVSGLIHDGLLKNLNGYYRQYHWNTFPASQLASLRAAPTGRPRGSGPLWAMGVNYSLTGVFYNKALAAKIGMKSPPRTLAELDALLAKAKAAGITPIVQFNGGATGGLLFPLQQLMSVYGPSGPINSWIFNKAGANIDTATNLAAINHLDADQGRVLQPGRQRHRLPNDDEQVHARRRPADLRRRLGVGELRLPHEREGRLLPDAAANSRREIRRDVGSAELRHRCETGPCGLRRVLPQLGRDEPEGAGVERCRRRLQPGRTTEPPDPDPEAGVGDNTDTRCRQARCEGQWGYGLHRERDRGNLRTELDAGGPKLFGGQEAPQTC